MRPPSDDARSSAPRAAQLPALSDEEVVERVLAGDPSLFEILMRRHNQRLFRIVRPLVRDDSEAEDILQETYVRAYHNLGQFEGRARFATWLTRIAIHDAIARGRRHSRFTSLEEYEPTSSDSGRFRDSGHTPEERASSSELRGVLERAIERIPEDLRLVFVLRMVDGLDTDETAECLGISAGNVKVRLHRARSLLRSAIDRQLGADVRQIHQFAGEQCDDVVVRVFERIQPNGAGTGG